MRLLIHLSLLSLATAELIDYLPPPNHSNYNNPYDPYFGLTQPKKHTDFYTYSAPNEYNDESSIPNQLAGLLRPQQVVFIRTPEKNLFTQTAEQLTQINPLEIYVLSRQTNIASLAQQYQEIRQRHEQKPSVHFVKYRTPQDVSRALATLKQSYEAEHPGSSINHREALAEVLNFSHRGGHERFETEYGQPATAAQAAQIISTSISAAPAPTAAAAATPPQIYLPINVANPTPTPTQIQTPTPTPVIFKIRPHGATDYETHIEAAKVEALLRQYLPSGLL